MVKKNSGNILLIILVAVGILAASVGGYFWWTSQQSSKNKPLTWEECLKISGSIQLKSYPGRCVTPDGRKVTESLSEEEKRKTQPPTMR